MSGCTLGSYQIEYVAADGRRMHRVIEVQEIRPCGKSVSIRALDEDGAELRCIADHIATCTALFDEKEISHPTDFFREMRLRQIEEMCRGVPLADMIDALPVDDIGPVTARELAKSFGTWDDFISSIDAALPEWKSAKTAREFFGRDFLRFLLGQLGLATVLSVAPTPEVPSREKFPELFRVIKTHNVSAITVANLLDAAEDRDLRKFATGHNVLPYQAITQKTKLSGRKIVFTGEMPGLSRDEARNMAELAGARVMTSVSIAIDFIVAGEKPGPEKMKMAQRLKLSVIGEAEFRTMTQPLHQQ